MTNEEAIEYNKNLKMYMKISDKTQPCKFLKENHIALDMAIKSLEAWEKVKKETTNWHNTKLTIGQYEMFLDIVEPYLSELEVSE